LLQSGILHCVFNPLSASDANSRP